MEFCQSESCKLPPSPGLVRFRALGFPWNFCFLTRVQQLQTYTAVPVTSEKEKKNSSASESLGQGDLVNGLSCHSSQLFVFHPRDLPHTKLCLSGAILSNTSQLTKPDSEVVHSGTHAARSLPLSFPESSPRPAPCPRRLLALMRGRDRRGRPLEFDKATCCSSTSFPSFSSLSPHLSLPLSLPTCQSCRLLAV